MEKIFLHKDAKDFLYCDSEYGGSGTFVADESDRIYIISDDYDSPPAIVCRSLFNVFSGIGMTPEEHVRLFGYPEITRVKKSVFGEFEAPLDKKLVRELAEKYLKSKRRKSPKSPLPIKPKRSKKKKFNRFNQVIPWKYCYQCGSLNFYCENKKNWGRFVRCNNCKETTPSSKLCYVNSRFCMFCGETIEGYFLDSWRKGCGRCKGKLQFLDAKPLTFDELRRKEEEERRVAREKALALSGKNKWFKLKPLKKEA